MVEGGGELGGAVDFPEPAEEVGEEEGAAEGVEGGGGAEELGGGAAHGAEEAVGGVEELAVFEAGEEAGGLGAQLGEDVRGDGAGEEGFEVVEGGEDDGGEVAGAGGGEEAGPVEVGVGAEEEDGVGDPADGGEAVPGEAMDADVEEEVCGIGDWVRDAFEVDGAGGGEDGVVDAGAEVEGEHVPVEVEAVAGGVAEADAVLELAGEGEVVGAGGAGVFKRPAGGEEELEGGGALVPGDEDVHVHHGAEADVAIGGDGEGCAFEEEAGDGGLLEGGDGLGGEGKEHSVAVPSAFADAAEDGEEGEIGGVGGEALMEEREEQGGCAVELIEVDGGEPCDGGLAGGFAGGEGGLQDELLVVGGEAPSAVGGHGGYSLSWAGAWLARFWSMRFLMMRRRLRMAVLLP